jgi:hypothetical protein
MTDRTMVGRDACVARWLAVLHALVAALALGVASAGRAGAGPLDILWLPADVDLAICVRGAAEASREPSGWAARQMADELSESLGLPGAWDELFKALDLPPEEAIDSLLGRRVVIAMRWPEGDAGAGGGARGARAPEPDWVVLSLVSEDTERRIRRRLRPVPRDVEDGQAILSLEDGRFYLTARVLDRSRRGEGEALLMLAPSAHIGLFKQMLPHLSGRGAGPTLGDDPHLARLARLLEGDIAMLSVGRAAGPLPEGGGDGASERDITAIGMWWRRGAALDAQGPGLMARVARIGPSVPQGVDPRAGFAPGQIDALGDGALLALADMIPAAPAQRGEAIDGAQADGPARRFAIGLPRSPGFVALVDAVTRMLDLPPETRREAVGPETIVVVRGDGTRVDPLSLTVGVAVSDLSVVAPSADRLMAGVLAAPSITGPATLGPDFRGAYPPAVRTASIPAGAPAHLGGLLGDSPIVSWHFAPAAGAVPWARPGPAGPLRAGGAGVAGGGPGKAGGVPQPVSAPGSPWAMEGWWVARLAQHTDRPAAAARAGPPADADPDADPAASLRTTSGVLTAAHEERGILTAGLARPALALAALAAVDVPIPVAARAIRWIDRVRWEGTLAGPGRLVVEVQIDLDPTRGATPP